MTPTRVTALVCLLFMFAMSGCTKIVRLGNIQTRQFTEVFGLSTSLAILIVFLAGVWECAAVGAILYGETQKSRKHVQYGLISLIAFTIIATLIFKVYPKFKKTQVLANMSVFGGLLLYYLCTKEGN